jgi:hypothetical protein
MATLMATESLQRMPLAYQSASIAVALYSAQSEEETLAAASIVASRLTNVGA